MFNHACHHDHENNNNAEQGQAPSYCGHHRIKNILPLFLAVLIIFFSVWSVESIVGAKMKLKEMRNITAERTLSVSAEGKVVATPDIANINFSVITEAKTAKEAQSKNTDKMNAIIDYVKSIGIDKKDIKTTSYYLSPKYEYPDGRSVLTGYILTNSISIKIRDFEVVGDLIAKSVNLGINQIGDVQFSIENPDNLKAQAGSLAIENAKAKAQTLSQKAGVRLGKIITFSESEAGGYIQPYYMKSEAFGRGGAAAPQLEEGSQEIKMIASIVFEIE